MDNTKKRLVASVLAMAMCFTMLVGSTFAWFTDTASTKVNTIQAGTLDIQLLDAADKNANSLEGKELTFAKAEGAEDEDLLFEPGATYELTQAWLYNAGNLHAKYKVVITGVNGTEKLAQVLDVIVDGTNCGTLAELVVNGGAVKENTIAPKAFDTFGTIKLKMKETAGNEYMGQALEGIAITVHATQAVAEYDSYNNTYDENAFEQVVFTNSQAELDAAIKNMNGPTQFNLADGTYTIPAGLNNDEVTFTGSRNAVINMENVVYATADSTLVFDGVTVKFGTENYKGFQHTAKVVYRNCFLTGKQFMYAPTVEFDACEFENTTDYCVWTYGATKATFTDCTFKTGGKAVLVYTESATTAEITLNSCTLTSDGSMGEEKAAVEVGESAYGNEANYTINMNDCTVNGFTVTKQNATTFGGTNLGTAFWGNKNLMPADRLNIFIDGVEVY